MYKKLFLFVLALSLFAANITFASNVIEIEIANGNDSVEEEAPGTMYMGSSDLEILNDGGVQAIGLRFLNVELPQGANIIEAYIVFTVDEIEGDEAANLIIQGQLVPDAPAFENVDGNVRDRIRVCYTGQDYTFHANSQLNSAVRGAGTGWEEGNFIIIEGHDRAGGNNRPKMIIGGGAASDDWITLSASYDHVLFTDLNFAYTHPPTTGGHLDATAVARHLSVTGSSGGTRSRARARREAVDSR